MTTQVTGTYKDIYRWDNLFDAYRKAAKGKRSKAPAAAFEFRLEDNLIQLQDELTAETYRPGPYESFFIHEPKRRLISAAPFRDRVVHHALCQVTQSPERSGVGSSQSSRLASSTTATPTASVKVPIEHWIPAKTGPSATDTCSRAMWSNSFRRLTTRSCKPP